MKLQSGGMLFDAPQLGDQLTALGFAVTISMILCFVAPFAWIPLPEIPLFIPVYDSLLVINDLVTAALFAALFVTHGRRGLLFLAAGYLWTALLATAHFLSFPGVFTELLPRGPQTTPWLYFAWHIGLPSAVVLYSVVGSRGIQSRVRALIVAAPAVAVIATGLIVLCTSGHDLLPALIAGQDDRWLGTLTAIAGGICLVAALAMGLVLGGRTRLDLWLALVMYVRIWDVALSGVFGTERYDIGWYGARFFDFIADSLVLYPIARLAVVEYWRRTR